MPPLAWLTRAPAALVAATVTALVLVAVSLYEAAPAWGAAVALASALLGWLGLGRAAPSVRAAAVCLLLAAFLLPAGLEFAQAVPAWQARGAAALAGAGLLAAAAWRRRDLVPPRLLAAGALVPAAVQAWDGAAKAAVAAQGRAVLLPLRPVDPRSLIQGDYMALAYELSLMAALPPGGGPVALRLDGDGVARAARPAHAPLAADEVLVRVHGGRHRPRLAPDSFLFAEGTAPLWATARFAMVRIQDGTLVLTGLADANRRPIRAPMQ